MYFLQIGYKNCQDPYSSKARLIGPFNTRAKAKEYQERYWPLQKRIDRFLFARIFKADLPTEP